MSADKLKLKLPFDATAYAGLKAFGSAFLSTLKANNLSLNSVFEVNQILCCQIERRVLTKNYSLEFEVNLSPSDINNVLLPQKLPKNCVMQGFTLSNEDHGQTINIGFNSYIGFIPKSDDR